MQPQLLPFQSSKLEPINHKHQTRWMIPLLLKPPHTILIIPHRHANLIEPNDDVFTQNEPMEIFMRQDEHMGIMLPQNDPMEEVSKQNEAIDKAGTQNECLDDILTQEVLIEDPADSSL